MKITWSDVELSQWNTRTDLRVPQTKNSKRQFDDTCGYLIGAGTQRIFISTFPRLPSPLIFMGILSCNRNWEQNQFRNSQLILADLSDFSDFVKAEPQVRVQNLLICWWLGRAAWGPFTPSDSKSEKD